MNCKVLSCLEHVNFFLYVSYFIKFDDHAKDLLVLNFVCLSKIIFQVRKWGSCVWMCYSFSCK